jgi:hypothetical protein
MDNVPNADKVHQCVEEIFDGIASAAGVDNALENHFVMSLTLISTLADVNGIMSAARLAAFSTRRR